MRFPDLAIRLSALRELHAVDYAELTAGLKLDKTSVWRWFQGAANLPEAKQIRLVNAMCHALNVKGVDLSEEDFRLNNTFEFLSKIGISKIRAAQMCGISLSVPEALIDAALEPQDKLNAFVGGYQGFWEFDAGIFARAWVQVDKQGDGRVTFNFEWMGDNAFTIHGYLCMIGTELSVIGDRIAGDFTQARSIFSMTLDVDFDPRTKSVMGLRGYMPDRRNGEPVLRRIIMTPTKTWDMRSNDVTVTEDTVKEVLGVRGLSFLTRGLKAV